MWSHCPALGESLNMSVKCVIMHRNLFYIWVKLGLDARDFIGSTLCVIFPTAFIQIKLDNKSGRRVSSIYNSHWSYCTYMCQALYILHVVHFLFNSLSSLMGYYYCCTDKKLETFAKYHIYSGRAMTRIQNLWTPKYRLIATTLHLHFHTNMNSVFYSFSASKALSRKMALVRADSSIPIYGEPTTRWVILHHLPCQAHFLQNLINHWVLLFIYGLMQRSVYEV